MANQIKKKYLGPNSVDGSKIKLLQNESLKGVNDQGQDVDLLKISPEGKVLSTGKEIAFKEDLTIEELARIAGDEDLQSKVDSEESARIAGDADLMNEIDTVTRMSNDRWALTQSTDTAIRSEFAAADASLQSAVDVEKGRVDAILLASDADKDSFAEIVQLINSVDIVNDSAFGSYVLSNNAALASEASAREQGDEDLQSNIVSESNRAMLAESDLNTVINGVAAGFQLGDATEKARAMGIESSLQSQITQEVSDRQSAVSSEASARQSADSSLQSQITQEVSDRQAADSVLTSSISSEVSARQAADADLQSQHDDLDGYAQDIRGDLDQEIVDRAAAVSAEASARQSADSSLQSSLSSEISRAQSAESTEQAARIAGDASLQSSLNSEISSRQSADSSLQSQITQEISDRQSAISSEESARISGDASTLQSSKDYTDGKISLVMSNLDTEALDSLVEIVAAFQAADSDLNGTISALGTGSTSALAAEIARAESAEAALDQKINDEESRAREEEVRISDLLVSVCDGAGLDDSNGSYSPNPDAWVIGEAVSLFNADQILDQAIMLTTEALSTETSRAIAAEQSLEDNKVSKSGDTISGALTFQSDEVPMMASEMRINEVTFEFTDMHVKKRYYSRLGSDGLEFSENEVDASGQVLEPSMPAMPSSDFSVTTKAYVDQQDQNLSTIIDVEMERAIGVEQSLQAELDATQVGSGLQEDGSYVPNEEASYIDEATSLYEADQMLAQTLVQFQSDFQYSMNLMADSVNTEGANRIAADDALSVRIEALEVQTDGPYFGRSTIVCGSGEVFPWEELDHQALSNSIRISVGRLSLHEADVGMPYGDFSVSVVNGKSRIVWNPDFLSSEEGMSEGDVVYITYAYSV